jgi:hypothetical protein
MWAFGIIMLELATGHVPRQGMGFQALVMQTVHGDVPSLSDVGTKHNYSKVHLRPLHRGQVDLDELCAFSITVQAALQRWSCQRLRAECT